jgi:2-dehydro-3-deoxygluconokinase
VSVILAIGEGLIEVGIDESDGSRLLCGYGGDAPNCAAMAALAGAGARICGRVGDDAAGRLLVDFWRACGVDTRFVKTDASAPTGLYINEGSPAGHRFRYYRSASAGSRLHPDDVTSDVLDGVHVVYLTGITLAISQTAADASHAAIERGRIAGALVAFAVNYRAALAPDLDTVLATARSADVVFVSSDEAELLVGEREPERVAHALGTGPSSELVVTSGSRGAAVLAAGAWSAVPAPEVTVVDAAGAGDALAGCYLAERARGQSPCEALRVATAAASLSCARWGCAVSYPNRAELDGFCRQRPSQPPSTARIVPQT